MDGREGKGNPSTLVRPRAHDIPGCAPGWHKEGQASRGGRAPMAPRREAWYIRCILTAGWFRRQLRMRLVWQSSPIGISGRCWWRIVKRVAERLPVAARGGRLVCLLSRWPARLARKPGSRPPSIWGYHPLGAALPVSCVSHHLGLSRRSCTQEGHSVSSLVALAVPGSSLFSAGLVPALLHSSGGGSRAGLRRGLDLAGPVAQFSETPLDPSRRPALNAVAGCRGWAPTLPCAW